MDGAVDNDGLETNAGQKDILYPHATHYDITCHAYGGVTRPLTLMMTRGNYGSSDSHFSLLSPIESHDT